MSSQPTARSRGNMLKNVFLLSGMWGMGLGAAFVQIPSAQNVMIEAGHGSISTVPLGLIIFLSSPCAVMIPELISRHGEKRTFVAASILSVVGALMQMAGVLIPRNDAQLALVLVGAAAQSFTYASSNNLRFAVARFSTPEFLPKATALVLFGGVLSSLCGPLLSNVTRSMIPGADYAGNFLQIAVMYFVFGVLATLADFEPPEKKSRLAVLEETLSMILMDDVDRTGGSGRAPSDRSLVEILKRTDLALLTLFQCLSYNIMALYMTQVQFPMMALGYDANSRTVVITAHMIGMFLPGLISGHVINWIGTWATTFVGFLVFVLGGGLMRINDSLVMFNAGMATIGIGWNLSFVGPSAQVSNIHSPSERAKVVGFNDGIMLLTIGIFALSGSAIYEAIGNWPMFIYVLMGVSVISALIALWRGITTPREKSSRNEGEAVHPLIQFDSFFDELVVDSL